MARNYTADRRDDNEPDIIEVLRRFGFVSFDDKDTDAFMSRGMFRQCGTTAGRDLDCMDEHGFFMVEVKDGSKPPSKRKLTDREKKMQLWCIAMNVPYLVWESVDDVVSFLNERRLNSG